MSMTERMLNSIGVFNTIVEVKNNRIFIRNSGNFCQYCICQRFRLPQETKNQKYTRKVNILNFSHQNGVDEGKICAESRGT